jgi:hypothetical protein
MNVSTDQGGLADKLMAPVSAILAKHGAAIQPLLQGNAGNITHAALNNDDNVRKVASFCYPLLPGLVRLAVKEPAFVNFVMNNRERVLARLVAPGEARAGAA